MEPSGVVSPGRAERATQQQDHRKHREPKTLLALRNIARVLRSFVIVLSCASSDSPPPPGRIVPTAILSRDHCGCDCVIMKGTTGPFRVRQNAAHYTRFEHVRALAGPRGFSARSPLQPSRPVAGLCQPAALTHQYMAQAQRLNHKIWRIAWPAILSNISTPLLGHCRHGHPRSPGQHPLPGCGGYRRQHPVLCVLGLWLPAHGHHRAGGARGRRRRCAPGKLACCCNRECWR